MEDNWENLAGALPHLNLSERSNATSTPAAGPADSSVHASDVTKPPTPPPAESNPAQPQHQGQQQTAPPLPVPEYEAVDPAIRQALADPTQRVTVIKCEELVEKFLADPCQETLQFPASFSSYQRMLAHRVGQYYGLQTSTVDYEDSQGRVVAIRLKSCYDPKPRLRDMDIHAFPVAQRTSSANGFGAEKPRLLTRRDDERSHMNSSEHSLNQSPIRSIKERQENYMKAREELGLGGGPHEGMGRGGRGPGGRFGNGGGRMDGGRGRKAVFRDKDKELSDPDYRRGMNRFTGAARFDPAFAAMPAGGIYQVPTYSSEFPLLSRMPGGASVPPVRGPHPQQQQQQQQHPQQAHGVAPSAQGHPMVGLHAAHPAQAVQAPWGQQGQQQQQQSQQQGQQGQGPGGVRPPPPPPPPHQHAGGPGNNGPAGGANSGPGGKAHQNSAAASGGAMGSRHQQQQHQQQQHQHQQQVASYGHAMAAAPYPGVAAQYPMPMAVGTAGFVPGAPGQHVFGMATAAGGIPGAMYAAPAPGVGVSGAFYPGVGMGMGAVGMAVPATGAYGYVAAPAPGVGHVGMGAAGEAIALTPQAAYPVYASYPAYPAAAAAMAQSGAIHHPAGTAAAIPMRPMYGIPSFYPQYDPSQYGGNHQQHHQGEGRGAGGYGAHHGGHQHHGGTQHHGGGGGGGGGGNQHHHHGSGGAGGGHGKGRGDSDAARGEQQQAGGAGASSGTDAK